MHNVDDILIVHSRTVDNQYIPRYVTSHIELSLMCRIGGVTPHRP